MPNFELSRRETISALAASAALPLIAKATPCAGAAPATDAQASALLNSIGDNLLRLNPEGATSLGVDTGSRARLRYQLGDRSRRRPAAGCRDAQV